MIIIIRSGFILDNKSQLLRVFGLWKHLTKSLHNFGISILAGSFYLSRTKTFIYSFFFLTTKRFSHQKMPKLNWLYISCEGLLVFFVYAILGPIPLVFGPFSEKKNLKALAFKKNCNGNSFTLIYYIIDQSIN